MIVCSEKRLTFFCFCFFVVRLNGRRKNKQSLIHEIIDAHKRTDSSHRFSISVFARHETTTLYFLSSTIDKYYTLDQYTIVI